MMDLGSIILFSQLSFLQLVSLQEVRLRMLQPLHYKSHTASCCYSSPYEREHDKDIHALPRRCFSQQLLLSGWDYELCPSKEGERSAPLPPSCGFRRRRTPVSISFSLPSPGHNTEAQATSAPTTPSPLSVLAKEVNAPVNQIPIRQG